MTPQVSQQRLGPSVLLYRRYVDDTFCLKVMPLNFFKYINKQHPQIEFTMEKRNTNGITFLDVRVDNSNNQVITSISRKKTFLRLFTNYASFAPRSYKLGLVRTLIDRLFKVNNAWLGFNADLKCLIKILKKISHQLRLLINVLIIIQINSG